MNVSPSAIVSSRFSGIVTVRLPSLCVPHISTVGRILHGGIYLGVLRDERSCLDTEGVIALRTLLLAMRAQLNKSVISHVDVNFSN